MEDIRFCKESLIKKSRGLNVIYKKHWQRENKKLNNYNHKFSPWKVNCKKSSKKK